MCGIEAFSLACPGGSKEYNSKREIMFELK